MKANEQEVSLRKRWFCEELKPDTVRLVAEEMQSRSANAVAAGVHEQVLRAWERQVGSAAGNVRAVPEPATPVLLAGGGVAAWWLSHRRRFGSREE